MKNFATIHNPLLSGSVIFTKACSVPNRKSKIFFLWYNYKEKELSSISIFCILLFLFVMLNRYGLKRPSNIFFSPLVPQGFIFTLNIISYLFQNL